MDTSSYHFIKWSTDSYWMQFSVDVVSFSYSFKTLPVSDCSAFSLRLFIGAQNYRLKYISKWRCRLCSDCGLRGKNESFHPTSQGRCVRESASVMHRAKISWQKAAFVIWKDRGALATAPWYFTKQTSVGSGAVSKLTSSSLLSLPTALQALKLQHLDGVDPKVHTFISSYSFKGARIRGRIPGS